MYRSLDTCSPSKVIVPGTTFCHQKWESNALTKVNCQFAYGPLRLNDRTFPPTSKECWFILIPTTAESSIVCRDPVDVWAVKIGKMARESFEIFF